MSNNGVNLYSYQKESVEFILNNIDNKHVLLAAAPNGGKTYISAFVIKELVKNGKRILCSVHGTNVLKKQFYDSICNIIEPDLVSVYDITDLSLYDPEISQQIKIRPVETLMKAVRRLILKLASTINHKVASCAEFFMDIFIILKSFCIFVVVA